jgi:hypothetical protein
MSSLVFGEAGIVPSKSPNGRANNAEPEWTPALSSHKTSTGLLFDSGFGGLKKVILYNVLMDQISKKMFANKSITEANKDKFAIYCIPQI